MPTPPKILPSYRLAGIVVAESGGVPTSLGAAWRSSRGQLDAWRNLLGDLLDGGRTRAAADVTGYAEAVDELLRAPT